MTRKIQFVGKVVEQFPAGEGDERFTLMAEIDNFSNSEFFPEAALDYFKNKVVKITIEQVNPPKSKKALAK